MRGVVWRCVEVYGLCGELWAMRFDQELGVRRYRQCVRMTTRGSGASRGAGT